MKSKIILSIDFDFFQDASFKIRSDLLHYPGGLDIPAISSLALWAERYANYSDLKKIDNNQDDIKKVLEFINKRVKTTIPVAVASSHREAYFFLEKYFKDDNLEIINIDYHMDLINKSSNIIACGNWLGKIILDKRKRNQSCIFKWIHPNEECYSNEQTNQFSYLMDKLDSLDKIHQSFSIDGIFFCRSDEYVPPHCDTGFYHILSNMIDNPLLDLIVSDDVYINRTKELKNILDIGKKQREEFLPFDRNKFIENFVW